MTEPLPALRAVEAIPTKHEGQTVVVLRDPEGICEGLVVLPLPAFFLASCFDGAARAIDVQEAFQQQFQHTVDLNDIESLSRQLDEQGLLVSRTYFLRKQALEQAYDALPARPAAHAGEAYPNSAEELKTVFQGYFTLEGGAGDYQITPSGREVAGLVLPHIDPRCGGRCASWALKELASSPVPDVFVIFGTSHHPLPDLFSVGEKDFETPLGTVPVDRAFIAALRQQWPNDRFKGGSLIHKTEHSIEFQVVFLHALYGDPAPFTIVPVLCGSLHEYINDPDRMVLDPDLVSFFQAMRTVAESCGRRVCYVAGADLAHMGRKFGDDFGLSDELIQRTRANDMAALEFMARMDAQAFFRRVALNGDEYKICGLSPMYAMLRCMQASEGKLMRHDYNLEAQTDSMVSFCSMVFYK